MPWPFERFAMLLVVSLSIKFVENVFPFFSGNQGLFIPGNSGMKMGGNPGRPGMKSLHDTEISASSDAELFSNHKKMIF